MLLHPKVHTQSPPGHWDILIGHIVPGISHRAWVQRVLEGGLLVGWRSR